MILTISAKEEGAELSIKPPAGLVPSRSLKPMAIPSMMDTAISKGSATLSFVLLRFIITSVHIKRFANIEQKNHNMHDYQE